LSSFSLLMILGIAGPVFGGSVQRVDEERVSYSKVAEFPQEKLKAFLSLAPWKGTRLAEHPWQGANFTDPRFHDPQNFLYVTTGLKTVPANAELLPDRPFASGSLISNEAVRTYSRFGFILEVTPENVIATFVTDGQTSRNDAFAYRQTNGVLAPHELINRTGWWYGQFGKLLYTSIYNEVLLDLGFKGSPAHHRVRVIGLYLIDAVGIDEQAVAMGWEGPALSSEMVAQAEHLARSSGLPLVRIKKDARSIMINREIQP
jgi:hypothetical protein